MTNKDIPLEQWEISHKEKMPDDPLLACLLLLTKVFHKPISQQALIAGLPLKNQRLTPDLFIRAAARAELAADVSQRSLLNINQHALPAVLLLKDKEACILLDYDNEGLAKIIMPSSGTGVIEMHIDELEKQYLGYVIYVHPSYQFTERSKEPLREKGKHWFWNVITKAWPVYSEVLVASLLINLFALAMPLFIMNVYDRVVPNHASETLWVLAMGIITLFVFDFIMRTLRSYFIDNAGKNIDIRLSSIIFEQIMGIRMADRPTSVGAFANTVQAFESFREFLTSTTVALLVDLPFVFLFVIIIYIIGGNLALVPLIALPLVIIVGIILQAPLAKLTQESYRYSAEKEATLIETLGSAETIKVRNAESVQQHRWEQVISLAAKVGIKLRFFANLGTSFAAFAQQMSSVVVVIFGVYKIIDGDLSVGGLIACTILTGRAMAPLAQVALLLTRYYQSTNALKSLNQVMELPIDRPLGYSPIKRPHLNGNIHFNKVNFTYPGQTQPALQNISLSIKAGEKVGIIGRIGSGKTTLAKLLTGLYHPSEGAILLDGIDSRQLDPTDHRNNVGYMPQDVVLFYGTVKQNINFGAEFVDDDTILRAANEAGVTRFVNLHPSGFEMQVGERGCNLSGGQRQSIAVARSLLLSPPILVLDEPSNSMDESTERALRQRLNHIVKGKTMVLMTHRASMLTLVDRLVVMDNGRIIIDGPKEKVIEALKSGQLKSGTI